MAAADDLAAWLRLTLVPGLGTERQRQLLAAFGLPGKLFDAGRSAVAGVVGGELADRLLAPPDQAAIDAALAWADQPGNHILTLADSAYPQSLLDSADPPVLLYLKGDPALLARPSLAVVGARSATATGETNAEAFSRSLCAAGLTIVSGLALGIDAAAHRGALDAHGAGTVAVIGTGADRIYPARNGALAREIASAGAIVSEFPLGMMALRHNFPRRNRIIAGLSLGVLVVEAAVGSGSLITARLATENGREVFAIPGSIHSPLSRGCHRLIRDGAKLVETAEDVLEELRGRLADPLQPVSRPLRSAGQATRPLPIGVNTPPPQSELPLDTDAARVLALIGHDPVDVDTLVQCSGLTVDALYAILLPMELEGRISRTAGNRFLHR